MEYSHYVKTMPFLIWAASYTTYFRQWGRCVRVIVVSVLLDAGSLGGRCIGGLKLEDGSASRQLPPSPAWRDTQYLLWHLSGMSKIILSYVATRTIDTQQFVFPICCPERTRTIDTQQFDRHRRIEFTWLVYMTKWKISLQNSIHPFLALWIAPGISVLEMLPFHSTLVTILVTVFVTIFVTIFVTKIFLVNRAPDLHLTFRMSCCVSGMNPSKRLLL